MNAAQPPNVAKKRTIPMRGSLRPTLRRCFVTDGLRLILPAYGAYAGGLSIRDMAFTGLFARPPLVGAIGSRRVHAVKFSAVAPD